MQLGNLRFPVSILSYEGKLLVSNFQTLKLQETQEFHKLEITGNLYIFPSGRVGLRTENR